MQKIDHNGLRTWIEVDRSSVGKNYAAFRSIIGKKVKLMSVVKSNAYGHSLIDFSKEMECLGADFLGVDSAVEAFSLRKSAIFTPILVLGYTLGELTEKCAEQNISITVSSMETLMPLLNSRSPVKVHIKVDTGMHRQGFFLSEARNLITILKRNRKTIIVEGLYTHFAAAKNPAFPKYTEQQVEEFNKWRKIFIKNGFHPIMHASATAGTLLFNFAHFDMVRVGIGMYGLWPSKEVEEFMNSKIKLRPVLSWKVIVSEIKKIKKGERIGYDLTEKLERDTIVGLCPVGYWHGLPRSLSSVGHFAVRATRAKILGRISMSMTAIDLSDVKGAKIGDEAVIIGRSGKHEILASNIAELADTIHYEVVTRLNPLIKRIYY